MFFCVKIINDLLLNKVEGEGAMRITDFCRNYFNPTAVNDANGKQYAHKNLVNGAKILSYIFILPPLFIGTMYGISKLFNRAKKEDAKFSRSANTIQSIANPVIGSVKPPAPASTGQPVVPPPTGQPTVPPQVNAPLNQPPINLTEDQVHDLLHGSVSQKSSSSSSSSEAVKETQAQAQLHKINTSSSSSASAVGSVKSGSSTEARVAEAKAAFAAVNSSEPVELNGIHNRREFHQAMNGGDWKPKPVVVGTSEFVPESMVQHLMANKRDTAIGRKFEEGTSITNMEGALHTFLTPIVPITMTGDYTFRGRHDLIPLENGKGRNVVMSAAVQPDFELGGSSEVVMQIIKVRDSAVEGRPLAQDFTPLAARGLDGDAFNASLNGYEEELRDHMVHHLMSDHRIPPLAEVTVSDNPANVNEEIRQLVLSGADVNADALKGRFVRLDGGQVVSLEALFNLYREQLRNEFQVLENYLPNGYVYTMDPPVIFARQFRPPSLLNSLQVLAFKSLKDEGFSFENLKNVGFNDFQNDGTLNLWQAILGDKAVPKRSLFGNDGHYIEGDEGFALVLHNNSDAFGQNIEFEGGKGSMDAVLGEFSDASCSLKRDTVNPIVVRP